jgi:hypothetical protein
MTGLLFARPESPLAKSEIMPNMSYFNHRSGNHIDVFMAGYLQVSGTITDGALEFSVPNFDEFRQEIESMTRWRYSGGVDLVLTNARLDEERGGAFLDFSSAIAINLDDAKRIGAIDTVEMFFEKIFRYAETQSGDDPTWGFSDQAGLRAAGSALIALVLSLLPASIQQEITKTAKFCVSDIRPQPAT